MDSAVPRVSRRFLTMANLDHPRSDRGWYYCNTAFSRCAFDLLRLPGGMVLHIPFLFGPVHGCRQRFRSGQQLPQSLAQLPRLGGHAPQLFPLLLDARLQLFQLPLSGGQLPHAPGDSSENRILRMLFFFILGSQSDFSEDAAQVGSCVMIPASEPIHYPFFGFCQIYISSSGLELFQVFRFPYLHVLVLPK